MKIKPLIKKKDSQQQPYIKLGPKALTKLTQYLDLENKNEFKLFGFVELKEEKYIIYDFLVPPQEENSPTFVTTSDDKYAEWLQSLPREERHKMRVDFHTHPKMNVTPSGTDEKSIQEKIEGLSGYYIRMIANHDFQIRVDFFDIENRKIYEECVVVLEHNKDYVIYTGVHGVGVTASPISDESKKDFKDKHIVAKSNVGIYQGSIYRGFPTYTTEKGYSQPIEKTYDSNIKEHEKAIEDIIEELDDLSADTVANLYQLLFETGTLEEIKSIKQEVIDFNIEITKCLNKNNEKKLEKYQDTLDKKLKHTLLDGVKSVLLEEVMFDIDLEKQTRRGVSVK